MDKALKIPDDQYRRWITELSNRYQRSQIKAATSVNREMLAFYWSLGRDVVESFNLLLTNPEISIIVMMTGCKDILTTNLDETSGTR